MESRFGHDFGEVRIHTDAQAAQSAEAVNALAYTVGQNVVFAKGQYQPRTWAGRRLLAHELTHVLQQRNATPSILQRDEDDSTAATETANPPSGELEFEPLDLLVYPLIVDIWRDIAQHRVSAEVLDEIRLEGPEDAALWNAVLALPFAGAGIPSDASFSDFLEGWAENAEQLQSLAGGSDFFLDLASAFFGVNVENYLGSDLFLNRLQQHSLSVVTVLTIAQTIVSTYAALSESDADVGTFEPRQWEQQTALVRGLLGIVLKEQLKAPDFFSISPIRLATHPVFAVAPSRGGNPPEGLTVEHGEGVGEGQGGERLRLGLTLNLPQIIGLASGDESSDPGDLQTYRGWQGSLWFNYERTDPTQLQRDMGTLPSSQFRTGTIFGGGGFLGLLEGGARYGAESEAGQQLTSWFLNGGFGYQGTTGDVLQRIGFTATYTDWEAQDILAPRPEAGAEGVAGHAFRIRPFTQLQLGGDERHQFSVNAALGFVTGSGEDFNVSDFRGGLSYTYMGDRAEGQFPIFKLDFAASVHRLDWWNPDSPLLTGLQARTQFDQFFLGGQLNLGAGNVPESRLPQITTDEDELIRARVPTGFLITAGVLLGAGAGNRP